MSHIGIFHYQVGRTDGVSLEIDKWKGTLQEMGHTVELVAGDLGSAQGILIPEMHHHRPDAKRLYYNTFVRFRDYPNEEAYRQELWGLASVIETRLRQAIADKAIDFLLPENIWSVAVNPAVAIAMARLMTDLQLPTLAHHHDFYWERPEGVALTCASALELADKFLPPHSSRVRHVVINSLAQRQLAERKGVSAAVTPNVFDFAAPAWRRDAYNHDFRKRIGLRENDVMVLQATRVIARKGIEMAVDFVRALGSPQRRARLKQSGLYDGRPFTDDSRIALVLAGYTRDDSGGGYVKRLRQKIQRAGIDALFIEEMVDHERRTENGRKIYSLWDTYVFADFVTYPSLWEGWGNQFLEAVRARLPIMLFEYPVYRADIGDKGFEVISLGSKIFGRDELGLARVDAAIIETAADQAIELLSDPQRRQTVVERNFEIARQHYSLAALRRYLETLMPG